MSYLLRSIGASRVRSGEGRLVSLLLAHSLGLGLFRAFYLSIANTQFVADFPPRYIPFAFLASGAIGYLLLGFFSALEKRLRFVRSDGAGLRVAGDLSRTRHDLGAAARPERRVGDPRHHRDRRTRR